MRPQDRRIVTGLFARWALLAAVSGLALGAVLLAGASVEHEAQVTLVPSDMLWGSHDPRGVVVTAWPIGPGIFDGTDLALCHLPGGDVRIMYTANNSLALGLPTPPPGIHPVTVQGIGYGPLAYLRTTCRIVSLAPDGPPVWLVDSTALDPALKDRPGDAAALLNELKRHGTVACYNEGPLADLAALSDPLRRLDPDVPVVLHRSGISFRSLVFVLHRDPSRHPTLVTANADLARTTAAAGFIAYLVDPAAKPTDELRLQVYPTLQALTDHLRDERETIEQFRPPAQPPSDAASRP